MNKNPSNANEQSFQEKVVESLARTGFVFENEVANKFRERKWGVITGRYYVDDVDGRARELDLVAYKIVSMPNIDVVTSLLISCKKNADCAWAIMTRERLQNDPNADLKPVHYWTSNEVLDAYLNSVDWRDSYIKDSDDLYREIFQIDRQAFAFQLISRDGSSPRNDRPIFESFTELVKALDHEVSVLPERMQKNRIYVFSLLVAIDAPMHEVSYDNDAPVSREIHQFKHLIQYIVKRRGKSARLHLCTKHDLPDMVKSYERLARRDAEYFDRAIDLAYKAAPENGRVGSVLSKRLLKKIRWPLNWVLRESGVDGLGANDGISLSFDQKMAELIIELPLGSEAQIALNDSDKAMGEVAVALKEVLRYSGKFRFQSDMPF